MTCASFFAAAVPEFFWPQNNSLDLRGIHSRLRGIHEAMRRAFQARRLGTGDLGVNPSGMATKCLSSGIILDKVKDVDILFILLCMYIYIYTHSICNYIIPFCHLCRLMAWKNSPGLGFGHVWSPGYSHSSGILTIGHTASGWFCSIYRTKTLLISLIEGSTNLILITWFNVSILWMLITMKSSPRK